MWERRSKGKFLEGNRKDSREVGRERAAKRTYEIAILADSSLFTEAANYPQFFLLLQERRSRQFRLLSILHYAATSIFVNVALFCPLCPKKAKLTLSEWNRDFRKDR